MELINGLLKSLGDVYKKASEVYRKNFSTTNRPRYLSHFNFLVIHMFDPHLMCIPSLHVMVMILTYTHFKQIAVQMQNDSSLNTSKPDAEPAGTFFEDAIKEVRLGALAITEAVLYIKQHSVNCIPAAMYAMTKFDDMFPEEEAESFAGELFRCAPDISGEDTEAIRNHIINLYRQFVEQGRDSSSWEKPLLDFLATLPKK